MVNNGWLLVSTLPLWKTWVRQLGWWLYTPNLWKNEKCSKPPTRICHDLWLVTCTVPQNLKCYKSEEKSTWRVGPCWESFPLHTFIPVTSRREVVIVYPNIYPATYPDMHIDPDIYIYLSPHLIIPSFLLTKSSLSSTTLGAKFCRGRSSHGVTV